MASVTIREWLASLGLSEYADRFAKHRIDFSTLRELTDQDLKGELEIAPLGDRRRLLRAIAELAGSSGASPQPMSAPTSEPRDEAERRQVTVMFADLVGSTALSVQMDPEDLREIISAYQQCVADTVRRFGGFVARYVGDGVLVYFGYPQAHEDDADRAVRAALALIAAVGELKTTILPQIRIGIATGLVVVGHLIPSGESEERGMVGETPNLAARLQGIAEPNSVIIDQNTRRLLGDLFNLQDVGTRDIKGIAGPVHAWAVLQASSVASRFEALHATGLPPLVGREEEAALLLRRWESATRGQGQVVLLSGEAGIGKSRLTATLIELLTQHPHTRLRYFCSPQHTDSALYPVIDQIGRAAGLAHADTPREKLDKLDALLKQSATSREDAALIAETLSLPNDGRHPVLELTPQQRRERTLDAFIAQMDALSRARPVLMVFEDAHWADPTSLELFGRAVGEIASRRVLLVVTFRPDSELPWVGRPHVTTLTLGRLAHREIDAIIDQLIGSDALPARIRQDLIERSDGIPLFVEEMTKAVLEAGSAGAAERTLAAAPSPSLAVPATLHASLMARLDRLGPAKELAQIGAAIGREFSHALLAAVVLRPEVELRPLLDRLINAGLLFRQSAPPYATYLFKHALVRDAAYSTLLREPRRALHARIAETLETQFPEIGENQPELLARHWTEAGQIAKASGLWGKAGLRSTQRSALVEAAEQLRRALDQIATLPSTPELRREEIRLQVALITPLLHVSGYATPETRAAVDRARVLIEQAQALGEPLEDPSLLFSVLYASWVANLVAFNGDVMRDLALQFLALADKQRSTGPLMVGHRLMGLSLLHTGDIPGARTHLDQAMTLYDAVEHRPLAMRFGQDVGAASLLWKATALWLLGYPEAALADCQQALGLAREIGHSATLVYVLNFSTWIYIHRGNYSEASALVDELMELKDQTGSLYWGAWGMMERGCILTLTGKASDAVQMIGSGVAALRSTRTTMWMPVWLSYLARASAETGQLDAVTSYMSEALAAVHTTKESWYEAELNRIAGEVTLLLPGPDVAKAESYFRRALAVARKHQARSWELRAAMSMARLWAHQGRRQQARKLLAPVQSWFTEGFDTLDLKQAKALLDELAQ
ncbi:MAG TPA: AAA family ATPase [Acetobacteraceae bacterium]|nr:AAA family ATPase [Acetobacteraceae bacterium]